MECTWVKGLKILHIKMICKIVPGWYLLIVFEICFWTKTSKIFEGHSRNTITWGSDQFFNLDSIHFFVTMNLNCRLDPKGNRQSRFFLNKIFCSALSSVNKQWSEQIQQRTLCFPWAKSLIKNIVLTYAIQHCWPGSQYGHIFLLSCPLNS